MNNKEQSQIMIILLYHSSKHLSSFTRYYEGCCVPECCDKDKQILWSTYRGN